MSERCTHNQKMSCPVCSKVKMNIYFNTNFQSKFGKTTTWYSILSKNKRPYPLIRDPMIERVKKYYPTHAIRMLIFYDNIIKSEVDRYEITY